MQGKLPWIVAVLLLQTVAEAQHWDDASTLITSLMAGYDKRIIPVLNQSQPLNANVAMYLMTIQDIDAVSGRAAIVASLHIGWIDEKLSWNKNSHNGINLITLPVKDIWYPKLILSNPFSEIKDIVGDWMTATVYQGYVSLSATSIFEATCPIDATYYPFDSQICFFSFTPLSYQKTALTLTPAFKTINTEYFTGNSEWELQSTYSGLFATTHVDTISFSIYIKRKPGYIVVNIIMPIIIMLILNILVFVIPADAGERISYAMTVLLALAVFLTLVGDNLPKTSEPMPLVSYYLMAIMILSATICVLTIVNLRLYHKHENSSPPRWCKVVTKVVLCKECSEHKSETDNVVAIHTTKADNDSTVETMQNYKDENDNEAGDISWKQFCKALDIVAIIVFTLALIIINAYYMHTLQYGKREEFDTSSWNSR